MKNLFKTHPTKSHNIPSNPTIISILCLSYNIRYHQKNQLQQEVDQALTQSITYNPKLILKTFILMLLGMGLLNILVILPSNYYLTQPILTKNETEILTDEDGTRYRAITSSKWIDCNTLNLSKKKVHPTEPNIHLTFPCFVEK